MGGHSGAEIDKNRANANALLGTFLYGLKKKADYELISVQGGQKDNAITRESVAELLTDAENAETVKAYAVQMQEAWREEYAGTDEGITVQVTDEGEKEVRVLHPTSKEKVWELQTFLTLMLLWRLQMVFRHFLKNRKWKTSMS